MTEEPPPSDAKSEQETIGGEVKQDFIIIGKYEFRHFPQLDGFRGLAVVFVIIGHLLTYGELGPTLTTVGLVFGSTGVFLFFVLSGFLITGLLQREKSEKGSVNLTRFYVRRALRLGPALLAFMLVILILQKLSLVQDVRSYEIAACLLYARNFFGKSETLAHIWSLSLEEQFYLCWPGIFRIIPEKRAFAVTTMVTTSIAIWRGIAIHLQWFNYNRGIFYMRPYFRFDSILIGACLAVGFATNARFLEGAKRVSRTIPAIALWLSLALWGYYGEATIRSLFLTVQMILIAAILCQLALDGSPLSQAFFSNRLLCYFGKISYALYLWQQVFMLAKLHSWGLLRQFPVNLAASVLMAMASYYIIEKPALRLKQHFE